MYEAGGGEGGAFSSTRKGAAGASAPFNGGGSVGDKDNYPDGRGSEFLLPPAPESLAAAEELVVLHSRLSRVEDLVERFCCAVERFLPRTCAEPFTINRKRKERSLRPLEAKENGLSKEQTLEIGEVSPRPASKRQKSSGGDVSSLGIPPPELRKGGRMPPILEDFPPLSAATQGRRRKRGRKRQRGMAAVAPPPGVNRMEGAGVRQPSRRTAAVSVRGLGRCRTPTSSFARRRA